MSMDAYRFGLYLGFTGMVSMAALSFLGQLGHSHGGHGGQPGGHGHAHGGHGNGGHAQGGHTHGHEGGVHHGHAPGHHTATSHHTSHSHHGHHESGQHSHHSQHQHHEHGGGMRTSDWFMLLVSPRVWFSVLLGFGATGILLKALVPALGIEPLRFILSAMGGIGFEKFIIAPLWRFWFRFATEGHTLDSSVAEEAQAVTNFDKTGHGLISLNLDGQIVQLLGKLSSRALEEGATVRAGDTLLVEAVDSQQQRCTVSPLKRL